MNSNIFDQISKVNDNLNRWFTVDCNGVVSCNICCICDRITYPSNISWMSEEVLSNKCHLLSPNRVLPDEVVEYYQYRGKGSNDEIKKCLLSSRTLVTYSSRHKQHRYLVCNKCKHSLCRKDEVPIHAIANGYEIGPVPIELASLTDVELSFISPVRCLNHLYTFRGGHRGIKGFHSLLNTNIVRTRRFLEQLDIDGHYPNTMVVMLHGKMTEAQRKNIYRRMQIRRDKCKKAIDWLIMNNNVFKHEYSNWNITEIPDPIVINESTPLHSLNSNIESVTEVTVVFPDSTLNEINGGLSNIDTYKRRLSSLLRTTNSGEIHMPLGEFVRDFEGENFMKLFPLLFPFGLGGPSEKRVQKTTGVLGRTQTKDYIQHITSLSSIEFHKPLVSIIGFNIVQRERMVRKGFLLCRGNYVSPENVNNLVPLDVITEIERQNSVGLHKEIERRSPGEKFLRTVEAVTSYLPHSNGASKAARKQVLAMQVKYGIPNIFFTVSPTDNNSLICSLYGKNSSGINVKALNDLRSEDIEASINERNEIRFRYPGISTMNFSAIIDVVLSCIVGWKERETKGGVFGCPKAYFYAVEEQARKNLHVHMLIWIARLPFSAKKIFDVSTKESTTKSESSKMKTYIDRILTCQFVRSSESVKVKHVCDNGCQVSSKLVRKNNQTLRFLRDRNGSLAMKGELYESCDCSCQWTSDDFSNDYAFEVIANQDGSIRRLLSEFKCSTRRQVSIAKRKILDEVIFRSKLPGQKKFRNLDLAVNGINNNHSTKHTSSCFKKDHTECRYKFPTLPRKRTAVVVKGEEDEYLFTGRPRKRRIVELHPKRGEFEVTMNSYSPIISGSTIACNSNVQYIADGVQAFYITKYASKDTQKEDSNPYENVLKFVQKRLLTTKFDSPRSECMSRILGASLAHGSHNIISATMAKYLISNDSRFGCSDSVCFVPLSESKKALQTNLVSLIVNSTSVSTNPGEVSNIHYISSAALNYLLRPLELENISMYEFVERFYIHVTSVNKDHTACDDVYPMHPLHPSRGVIRVQERKHKVTVGISNWSFPDASLFGGDILTGEITQIMEEYAESVLVLFLPHRRKEDLQNSQSYVLKLREHYDVLDQSYKQLLQNIQDIRNAVRSYRNSSDELEQTTIPFQERSEQDEVEEAMDSDEEQDIATYVDNLLGLDGSLLRDKHESLQVDVNTCMNKNTSEILPITTFSLDRIRDGGAHLCGYSCISNYCTTGDDSEHFVEVDNGILSGKRKQVREQAAVDEEDVQVSKYQLFRVLFEKRDRIVSTQNPVTSAIHKEQLKLAATGTAESLKHWARSNSLDRQQAKAFCVIVSHFILGYIYAIEKVNTENEDSVDENVSPRTIDSCLRREKQNLKKLAGKHDTLRMFLDGPGGSGKSEVLKQVLRYCRLFCANLSVPFTKHTIMVTVSTGVAATLINGSTVHSATYLSSKLSNEQIETFRSVRMLIIDEVSMIDVATLTKIDHKLRDLRENRSDFYGGLNIVFVGDFRQLDPVLTNSCALYHDLESPCWIGAINAYVETRGMYRFEADLEWGEILRRFRDGTPTPEDFEKINERVVDKLFNLTASGDPLPHDLAYVTRTNRERDAINSGIFNKVVQENVSGTIMIFSDQLGARMNKKESYKRVKNPKAFWEQYSEADICFPSRSTARLDPVLKLFIGCPVMFTENTNVDHCIANGTQGILRKVVLKKSPSYLILNDMQVPYATASEISYVIVHIPESDNEITIRPKTYSSFSIKIPSPYCTGQQGHAIQMTAFQLPFVVNCATTCHKLQGATKKSLFVNSFSYRSNWPYVAMSRVKSRSGLFLRHPLDITKDFSIDPRLKQMTEFFRHSKGIKDEILFS